LETDPHNGPKPFSLTEGLLLMAGFVLVSVIFAAFVGLVNAYEAKIALPMLSIAGIVLLLICLTAVTYVFSRIGLQSRTEALGLPAGSIQSVIALSLIVLFAILSVFLFTSLGGSSSVREIRNLSLADRNDQMTRLGSSFAGWEQQTDPEKYTIFVRDPGREVQTDVGKQLIVLIGTLMTSAVGFYFGSRATVSGAAAVNPGTDRVTPLTSSAPVIAQIDPSTDLPKGQATSIKIVGTGLRRVTSVAVRQGRTELSVADLHIDDTEIMFTLSPPATASPGAYDIVLLVGTREEVIRRGALTIAS